MELLNLSEIGFSSSEFSFANFWPYSSRKAFARVRLAIRSSLGPSTMEITLSITSVKITFVDGFIALTKIPC